MPKTIVQDYGPIYGEAANGSVLGRPNGSVYVPQGNDIKLTIPVDYRYIKAVGDGVYHITASDGVVLTDERPLQASANSQDLTNFIIVELSTTTAFVFATDVIADKGYTSGLFSISDNGLNAVKSPAHTTPLYVRAKLVNSNWQDVAYSDTIEVEWLE